MGTDIVEVNPIECFENAIIDGSIFEIISWIQYIFDKTETYKELKYDFIEMNYNLKGNLMEIFIGLSKILSSFYLRNAFSRDDLNFYRKAHNLYNSELTGLLYKDICKTAVVVNYNVIGIQHELVKAVSTKGLKNFYNFLCKVITEGTMYKDMYYFIISEE